MLRPIAFADRIGGMTPLVVALTSYPLFPLAEIGAEHQNPFSPRNLSHLLLIAICQTIESNVLSLEQAGLPRRSAAGDHAVRRSQQLNPAIRRRLRDNCSENRKNPDGGARIAPR